MNTNGGADDARHLAARETVGGREDHAELKRVVCRKARSIHVMPGRVPGIHVFHKRELTAGETWMAGHRRAEATPSFGRLGPAMTVEFCLNQFPELT